MNPLRAAIHRADGEWLARYVLRRFDILAEPEQLENEIHATLGRSRKSLGYKTTKFLRYEMTDSLEMWLKNRLASLGLLTRDLVPPQTFRLTVELHVAFIYFDETPEMLARLSSGRRKKDAAPKRSKFAEEVETQYLTGISATARRVAPGDPKHGDAI